MAQAMKTITLRKIKNTKNFSRYDVVEPGFTGSVYTPSDDNPEGAELHIQVVAPKS